MDAQSARAVFNAVGRAGAAVAALGEAAAADERGELTDEQLIRVIQDYLAAQTHLENMRNTQGRLGDGHEGFDYVKEFGH